MRYRGNICPDERTNERTNERTKEWTDAEPENITPSPALQDGKGTKKIESAILFTGV